MLTLLLDRRLRLRKIHRPVDPIALKLHVTINTGHALATDPDFAVGTFNMDASRAPNCGPLARNVFSWRMSCTDQPLRKGGIEAARDRVFDHAIVAWKERPDFKPDVLVNPSTYPSLGVMAHHTHLGAGSDNTKIEPRKDRWVWFEVQHKPCGTQQYASPTRTVVTPGMINNVVGTEAQATGNQVDIGGIERA
jgi:hypothetical protein